MTVLRPYSDNAITTRTVTFWESATAKDIIGVLETFPEDAKLVFEVSSDYDDGYSFSISHSEKLK